MDGIKKEAQQQATDAVPAKDPQAFPTDEAVPIAQAPPESEPAVNTDEKKKDKKAKKPKKDRSLPYSFLASMAMLIFGGCLFLLGMNLADRNDVEVPEPQVIERVVFQTVASCRLEGTLDETGEVLDISGVIEGDLDWQPLDYVFSINGEEQSRGESANLAYILPLSQPGSYEISMMVNPPEDESADSAFSCDYGPILIADQPAAEQ